MMLEALAEWPLAVALRNSAIVYPLVSAAHIASIGLLLGAVVTLDLRLLGAFRSHSIGHLAPPLMGVATVGLVAATVTGFLLFSTRPVAYAQNPAFLAKIGLLGFAVSNALVLRFHPWWRGGARHGEVPVFVQAAALFSLLCWLSAIVAGRWIGFLQ